MAIGNLIQETSPIVDAICEAEDETTSEIHVRVSQRWIERDPEQRAERIFHEYELFRTADRNAILFYVNLRKKVFVIIADEGAIRGLGQPFIKTLAFELEQNLRSTQSERAIALTIRFLSEALKKAFPSRNA